MTSARSPALAFAAIWLSYFVYSLAWNTEAYVRPFWREAFGLSLTAVGWIAAAQALGAIVGAVALGALADRIGRGRVFIAIVLAIAALSAANAFAQTFESLLAVRFLLGVALGGVFGIAVSLYVGLFPPERRGKLAALIGIAFNAAGLSVSAMGALLAGWDASWRWLLWGAAGLGLLAAAALWLALTPGAPASAGPKPRLTDLFAPGLRGRTALLVTMCGLNFFAFQAFSGWVTTYLRDERGFSDVEMGLIAAWPWAGNILGALVWGALGDRLGRRFNAVGFIAAAGLIGAYLAAPPLPWLLSALGFGYGFFVTASVIWGPWFAELYPEHLRASAASIFNWGRIVSFAAPVLVAGVAERAGLGVGMLAAAGVFLAAAGVWLALPETLARRSPPA